MFIDEDGKRLGIWRCPLPAHRRPVDSRRLIQRLLVQNFIAMPAPLFRRDLALQVGGLNESLWYTADWDFWLKVATVARTAYLPEPLTAFRLHSGSQTVRGSQKLDEFRGQLESVLYDHLGAYKAGGGDGNPGTLEKPFATLQRAQQAVQCFPAMRPPLRVRARP